MPDAPEPDAPPDAPEAPPDGDPPRPEDDGPFDEARARAKIAKSNSEAANLRKRLKDLEPLAKKAQELEDANKSDSQRLTERARSRVPGPGG